MTKTERQIIKIKETLNLGSSEMDLIDELIKLNIKLNEKTTNMKTFECPHCEKGDLRPVPIQESKEVSLWCDTCDLSMDSSGGYIA